MGRSQPGGAPSETGSVKENILSSPDISVSFSILVFFQRKKCVPSDGFMSSLGCQEKARVGHLYRGRDCENNQLEGTFERKCYCRYDTLSNVLLAF